MSLEKDITIAVAGHVCLDIIPEFGAISIDHLIEPGKLFEIGSACLSTGGAVSNVGIALHKLGLKTRLLGKVGDDLFGQAILNRFNEIDSSLTENMIPVSGESSSYTIVVNPPGRDRSFWHHPGCNNTYSSRDISDNDLSGISLFHFGYPPLMRQMFENAGEELVSLFKKVKSAGIISSLDMAYPDPNSYAGKANWRKILERVLPFVDIFLPSLDEIRFMLGYGTNKELSGETLSRISGELIDLGACIVGLKLGDQGFYLRTSGDLQRLGKIVPDVHQWTNREIYSPCYKVDVKGATGSGDATIAGFLASLIKGNNPENTINTAIAVGACSVETIDASSGIPDWSALQNKIKTGWEKRPVSDIFDEKQWFEKDYLLYGPADLNDK